MKIFIKYSINIQNVGFPYLFCLIAFLGINAVNHDLQTFRVSDVYHVTPSDSSAMDLNDLLSNIE